MSADHLRVLMLNYEFPPLGGGGGNTTKYLLEHLRDRDDIMVDLVTSSTGQAETRDMGQRITGHFLDIGKDGNLHYQRSSELLNFSRKAYFYCRELTKSRSYDVCLAFFGIPCGAVAPLKRIPTIVSLQGSDVPFYSERFSLADDLIFQHVSKYVWKNAFRVVANSSGLRRLALTTAPEIPIEVIPNGVDVDSFTPLERKPDGTLKVVCISRLIPRKGIDLLIKAVSELPDDDILLTIAGTGSQEKELRGLAEQLGQQDRVHFTGYMDHSDLPEVYRNGDIYALPTSNEGMSNTVLEAIASGLPLVVTRVGGMDELLTDAENGFFIDRSVKSIKAKLRHYLDNQDDIIHHGRASRKVAESMSWQKLTESYVKLFEEAAASR